MKRLLSLLLVIAMLFGVCTMFTACSDTDSSQDDDEKKEEEEEEEVEPTLVFRGLKVVLPADFETDDYEEGSNYVELENETYGVNIMGDPLTGEMEGLSAKELRDYYVEMLNLNGEDNGVGEFDSGKKNGTPYLYAVNEDGTNALVMAFYVDDNYGWLVQIRPLNTDEEAEFNIDDMIQLITGWKCKAPDLEEEEEDEGDEGDIPVPQPPTAATIPGMEEVAGEVIYDNMGIVVKWVDMYDDGYYTSLKLYVENNSGYNIELYGKDFVLNYSATFPADLFCFLGDGESSFNEIHLYDSELEQFGAEMVGSLDFTIEVINSGDYQVLDEGTRVSIKTEYDGYYNDFYAAGALLFDEGHVRMIMHEIQLDGMYESYLWLYIENLSDQTVMVSLDDFYSMGWFLADASAYESVLPGTYTIVGVDLSELYNLGIEYPHQIENMTGNVYCMDEEYNMLFSSEFSYCVGDPNAVYNYDVTGTTLYSGEGLEVILTDIVETEYGVELTVYFYNSWDSAIRINLDSAKINGHDTDFGMGIPLDPYTQHMGTLYLWYEENCDFTCLEDLTSLFLDLEAHDNGYYELVHQQIEIPLN